MNTISRTVLLIFITLTGILPLKGQYDSLIVSILTCSPGQELYSIYGHNALRIQDARTKTDVVFNYGTFDFDTPGFAIKFMRGKLPYLLSANYFEDFLREYNYYQRSVTEQILNIDTTSKKQIATFLAYNMLPENRAYKYDFFKDNCATRLRDVLVKNIKDLHWNDSSSSHKTYRQIIKEYQQYMPWTDFGIDLIIGAPADIPTTHAEEMFIPDYLASSINTADFGDISGTKLLLQQKDIITFNEVKQKPLWICTPEFFFALLFLIELLIYNYFSKGRKIPFIRMYDQVWMVLISLCGLLMLFMWFGTDHIPTKYNWNILWANILIPVWYYFGKNRKWINILLICIVFCLLISAINTFPFFRILPQYFHPAAGTISLILLLKVWRIYRTKYRKYV